MKVIIISGTPGTGKTTLGKSLAKALGFQKLALKSIIRKIKESYDRKKQCYVVDVKKLNKEIITLIKNEKQRKDQKKSRLPKPRHPSGIIISSHLVHNLPKKFVDLCIIVKCSDLKKLKKRLASRKYSKKKIAENLECEIFDVCLGEAKKRGHRLLVVDTAKKIDLNNLVRKIRKITK